MSKKTSSIFKKTALASAITTVLAMSAHAQVLEEVVVTATKKRENLQDVAISVNAFNEQTLQELNVENFEDYVRYQPNLTAAGNGPGQSSYYIRGVAASSLEVVVSEVAGLTPTVAVYLDEQPVTAIGRNLDIYVADMERIEVLTGPQGTLFGASSSAGTVRLITNKPRLDEFDAGVNADIAFTEGGEMSNAVDGFLNIPITDDFAVRAVFYNALRGGFIDNVEGSFTLPEQNPYFPAAATLATASNATLAEEDYNDVKYTGGRLSAKYAINDDWDVNVQYLRQQLETDGVFAHQPDTRGDLNVEGFFPEFLEDDISQVAWTINGRLGALEVLYTGAYLDRTITQSYDYTGYTEVGLFVPYYICNYPAYTTCGDPTYGATIDGELTRNTHEIRISTPQEHRIRAIAGFFYDDAEMLADVEYVQPGREPGAFPLQTPISTSTIFNPDPRSALTTFVNDVTRGEEQWAAFGEVTFDVIPETMSVTGGIRYYNIETSLAGSTNYLFRGATDGDYGVSFDAVLAGQSPNTDKDTIFKGNVTWTPNEDMLFYFTYSEGFRPGGFNRNGGLVNPDNGNSIPYVYGTDSIENYEIGWKLTALDSRLRFNGAIYQIDWTDMQLSVANLAISNLTFVDNIGESRIRGIEGDIALAATENLILNASFSYNDTELREIPGTVVNIASPGSELAFTPEFQFNIRARYEWEVAVMGGMTAHVQGAFIHADSSYNSIVTTPALRLPLDSRDTVDASFGLRSEHWSAEVYGQNLTDDRSALSIDANYPSTIKEVVSRPLTIGLRLSYFY